MTKDEWKKELESKTIEDLGEQDFDVNDWGSCQYSGALAFFNTWQKMAKDLQIGEIASLLNIELKFSKIKQLHEVRLNMINDIVEQIRVCIPRQDVESIKYHTDTLGMLCEAGNTEELFHAFRKSAWDLWTVAPYVAKHFIEGLEISGVPGAPGIGPEWNHVAQSQNYQTGLYCALLVQYGFVKDSNCFADFDT